MFVIIQKRANQNPEKTARQNGISSPEILEEIINCKLKLDSQTDPIARRSSIHAGKLSVFESSEQAKLKYTYLQELLAPEIEVKSMHLLEQRIRNNDPDYSYRALKNMQIRKHSN